jgi:hypothetical protein
MNDTLKKCLLYGLGGLLPVWLLDTVLLPRLELPLSPVLLPICVVALSVLEGAFPGAQFGLAAGTVWALCYTGGSPGRIVLLTLVGMVSGVVSQYALRRSLSGCILCAAGTLFLLEGLNILGGIINDLGPAGALLSTGLGEFFASILCAPIIYLLFYHLYRKAGGKPV